MHFIPQPLRLVQEKILFSQSILSFVQASYVTLLALFLYAQGLTITQTGYVTALLSLASLLILLLTPLVVREYHSIKWLVHLVFFWAVALVLLLLPAPLWFVIILALTLSVCASLTTTITQSMLYENNKQQEHLQHLLFDAAWIISPYFAGIIAYVYDIPTVFLILSIILFLTPIFLFDKRLLQTTKKHLRELEQLTLTKQKAFFSQQKHARAYFLSLAPSMWFALTYTFIPIYMFVQGYNFIHIGLFVTLSSIIAFLGSQATNSLTEVFGTYRLITYAHTSVFTILLLAAIATNIQVQLVLVLFATAMMGVLETTQQIILSKQTKQEAFIMSSKHPLGTGITQIALATSLIIFPLYTIFLLTALLLTPLVWLSIKA